MITVDPKTIDPVNNPFLVFTSQTELVSDLIELREDGSWNQDFDVSHMMTMTIPGLFNCQDPGGFHQIPVADYMVKGTKIFFFNFMDITPQAYQAMMLLVNQRLGNQSYDWLQIAGQAIGLDFLHMPGTEDCSEEGVREMKGMSPYLSEDFDDYLIKDLSNQSNPQQVFDFCMDNPAILNFIGCWVSPR